jgi:hypothetical protein
MTPRRLVSAVLVLVLVAGIAVGGVIALTGGDDPITADLWVDPDGGSCTRADEPAEYDADAACPTFDAAYQAAASGDTVRVLGGTYADGKINRNERIGEPGVTFRPADEEARIAVTGGLSTGDVNAPAPGADWFTFDMDGQLETEQVAIQLADDVTYDGIVTKGGGSYVSAAVNPTLRNMDMCCTPNGTKLLTVDVFRGDTVNFVLEDSVLHDQTQTNDGDHFECLYLNGTQGITLRRNVFYGCKSTGNLLITRSGEDADQPARILVEGNVFEPGTDSTGQPTSAGAFSIQDETVAMPLDGCVIRDNIFPVTAPDLANATSGAGCRVEGNIGAGPPDCLSHTYEGNTWTSVRCPGDNPPDPGIVDASRFPDQASHDWKPG